MIITLITTALPLIIILFVFGMISGQIPNTLSTGQFMAFFAALTMTVVAVLLQSQLMPGNIASNIIGMTNATFDDAWEAARND
jgi:hypothetical protein